jgi:adenosylhomocysteine nucleosidase
MSDESKPTHGAGWVFLFALRREAAPFIRRYDLLRVNWATPPPPCPAWMLSAGGKRVLVFETGVGAEQARRAIQWLLRDPEELRVVACGFAGALAPAFKVGDVLLASEVVEPDDDLHWRTAVPVELGDLPIGRLVTVKQLAGRPSGKRSLARQTGAVMVDMESAAIAEACQERRVPCAVVRAISDELDTELSHRLVELLAGGRVAPWRVLMAVARSPGLAAELWRLARDTRLAARRLADALHRLVQ